MRGGRARRRAMRRSIVDALEATFKNLQGSYQDRKGQDGPAAAEKR
jgi:hypothetical protein